MKQLVPAVSGGCPEQNAAGATVEPMNEPSVLGGAPSAHKRGVLREKGVGDGLSARASRKPHRVNAGRLIDGKNALVPEDVAKRLHADTVRRAEE